MSEIVSGKTYIFHFNLKKFDLNPKIPLFKQNIKQKTYEKKR